MSIFSTPVRPEPVTSDEAVRRYIDALRHDVEPDPLFRRRLRGRMLNRFVAMREGTDQPTARLGSRMGVVGRACLYASVATAMSVAGVMVATQSAIPGDILYPLKRSIEAARMGVLPEQFHDELAAHAMSERIDELSRLVESGRWAQAAALAGAVRDSYDELSALSDGHVATGGMLQAQLAQLERLLDRLPAAARDAVERAMAGAPGLAGVGGLGSRSNEPGSQGGTGGQDDGGASSGPDDTTRSAERGRPDREEQPERTPKPDRTTGPERTPKPKPNPNSSQGSQAP